MTPAKQFVADMLALIRRDFFAKLTERQFYQERPMLMRAITYPSRYLAERGTGATATIGLVRRVLMTVIGTIKSKGDTAAIQRFSVYFLFCVQRHMQIHGEEYYMAAKAPKSIAALVPGSMRRIAGALDSTGGRGARDSAVVETLAEVHRILSAGARIRKGQKTASEMDLFRPCKRPAAALQKPRNLRQTFAKPPDSGASPPNLEGRAADSI